MKDSKDYYGLAPGKSVLLRYGNILETIMRLKLGKYADVVHANADMRIPLDARTLSLVMIMRQLLKFGPSTILRRKQSRRFAQLFISIIVAVC